MNKKTKLLGQEKMSKTLLIMGIPTMVGMLVSALYNIVDAYYVSKIGKLALAAVTVVNPLSYIGMFVGLMFGCGGNAVIARAFGAGKKEEAKQVSATAIFAGLGTIAVFIISILLFLNPVLKILGAIQDYHELAVEYAVIFTIGLFFNVFNMCMNNMIVAEGSSVVSMTAMFVGAIVNILLDPILIFALDMGVFGAGMATLIARMVSSVIYIFYVCKKESIMSLNPMDVRFQANFFKSVLAAGLPVALFQLVSGAGQTVLNYLAGGYGVDAQAAIGIVNKVMFLELNLLYGFFKGYSPVVGYNYGAGKQERVKEATRLALTWSTGATFLCGCFLILFRNNVIGIFNQGSEQVARIGGFCLAVYAISYLTYGYQIIIGNFFIAIGETKRGGMLSLGKGLLYLIYIALLERLWGLPGLICAQLCTDITGTIVTAVVYSRYNCKFS